MGTPPPLNGAEFLEALKAPKNILGLNKLAPKAPKKMFDGPKARRPEGPTFEGAGGSKGGGWVGGWAWDPPPPPLRVVPSCSKEPWPPRGPLSPPSPPRAKGYGQLLKGPWGSSDLKSSGGPCGRKERHRAPGVGVPQLVQKAAARHPTDKGVTKQERSGGGRPKYMGMGPGVPATCMRAGNGIRGRRGA